MAKKEVSPNKIIRLDGFNCFVEVLNDFFSKGKVHFGFYTYDVKQAKGSRYTNQIHIFLNIPEFLALAADVSSGRLYQAVIAANKKKEEQKLSYAPHVFEVMGGTSAGSLRAQGKGRPDNKGVSRQFRIIPGTKKPFLLSAEQGPGNANATGLIVPDFKSGQAEQKVMVPLDYNMLLRLTETVKMHLQAYYSSFYFANPIPENSFSGNNENDEPEPPQNYGASQQYEEPQSSRISAYNSKSNTSRRTGPVDLTAI